ncbi:MAG: type II toxin-antitoxin system VapC family toxin [Acidimicrobiaceae bacterium]|nr:type II toxin-antitoxin system VapC family toxin [Acidimicrobiaceae bacterium]MXY09735.1 type II toxin-antitoxin system VapC family toxin [Acidimicrobiaceae bacterium]MXZ65886.1 type II toxin-antitoxin system VapC family toxin [Acidimicrobiaceae bacterium]MYF32104.1 type II toxin-antitoxin system VapC family toxin [Acidimicrobiaceae bacterium]MYG78714.1 type II toxin-antitoxin system VapC family toxin [Acidimicrobiaceae bacterium]
MIVVDASVATEAVGGSSDRNLEALRRITREAALAPHLLDLEVASALRGLVRRGGLAEALAQSALRYLAVLPVTRCDHRVLLPRCWELRDNLTVYDAAYVALAEATGATLLTSDQRLAKAPGIRCEVELQH